MLSTRSSSLQNFSEVRPRRRAISPTMRSYSGVPVVEYRSSLAASSPSKSRIMRREISSRSLFDDVNPMKGQPYTSGGHDMRACTALAPPSKKVLTLSRNCVPRTIESSQKTTLLPSSIARLGISFILATRSRRSCELGVKLRGQVGVYFKTARR